HEQLSGSVLRKRIRKIKRRYNRQLANNKSMAALDAGLAAARAGGYKIRPSQPAIQVGQAEANQLRAFNLKLLTNCKYTSNQDAVNASGNTSRVETMPGTYTEPKSRAKPTNDPACAGLKETNDKGSTGAVSYRYQAQCPNDQNLIAVIGRQPGPNP